MERIFLLSDVTFNKICNDLYPYLDKEALFALTRACNTDIFPVWTVNESNYNFCVNPETFAVV